MTEKPKEIGEHNRANPKLRDLDDELFDEEHPYRSSQSPRTQREALEAEVKCYGSRGRHHKLKFCYVARSYDNMYRERVRELHRSRETGPGRAGPDGNPRRRRRRHHRPLVGVPPYPAMAILENLLERGEIGPPE